MNIQQIKEKLNSKEYDFLRNDKHLGNNIMLLTLGGSYAYGTNVPTSDLDIRGITMELPEEIIGLSNFEMFENKETDTSIYGFKKMIFLLLNANPNTIEIMGTNPDSLFILSEEGKLLRDNVNLFLTRKAIHSFGGYANQQLRRAQNALARDSYPQTEKEKHILNSIIIQMKHLQEHYQQYDNDAINLYIDKSDKEDFDTEIFLDINLKHYPLRDFKNIHSEMSNVVTDYSKLGKRNSKKDELHLNKHFMHLIRLFIMGTEILEGKGIHTYRSNDREFLLSIRDGQIPYDTLFEIVNKYERRFQYAKENSPLPEKPDYHKVEDLVMSINVNLLEKYGIM